MVCQRAGLAEELQAEVGQKLDDPGQGCAARTFVAQPQSTRQWLQVILVTSVEEFRLPRM